jgi:hypothetical protein
LQLRKAVPDDDLKFRDVGTSMGRVLLSCIIFCSESTIFLPDKEGGSYRHTGLYMSILIELDDEKISRKALYLMVKTMVSG